MNLELLRRKRVKRLGIKSSKHTGQRRIFFVLDRATRRFHGDLALWTQYIEYARKESATKKLEEILTSALRMHPSKPEFWIYAAQTSLKSQEDMYAARGYMQRGLRFCKNSRILWLEYAKLEMLYIAKIAARRNILGLDGTRKIDQPRLTADDSEADMISLPVITAEDINPSLGPIEETDEAALRNLGASPALAGAIPIVIYDTAMDQFQNDDRLAGKFFELFIDFAEVSCSKKIVGHVIDHMLRSSPNSPLSWSSFLRQPVVGVPITSAEFPRGLITCLDRLKEAQSKCSDIPMLSSKAIQWMLPILEEEDVDEAVRHVLSVMLRQSIKKLRSHDNSVNLETRSRIADSLRRVGFVDEATQLQGAELTEMAIVT